MQKIKKTLLTSALLLLLAGALFTGLSSLRASATTTTTSKYTTYGSYTDGSTTKSGYPSNFKVIMHGSSTSGTGTMYNDKLTDWSYYYFKVEASEVREHKSFKLYRNGYLNVNKTLSGNGDLTMHSASLTDGEYELQYVCNIGNFFINSDYTYTYRFEVDKTAPTYTLKAGGSTISSGSYTNKEIVYTASDANLDCIRYTKPSSSSYSSVYASSYTVSATQSNNGWWYFFALDDIGNSNSLVSVYLDTVAPVGTVTNASNTTIENGGYTNSAIKYTATDTGGVSYCQLKRPNTTAWETYTAGTTLTSTAHGWYTFRAIDKAGNISAETKVYYDTTVPTATLYGGTTSKPSGSYTNAAYVKYSATDAHSGIESCYVKMPNSSYFTAYAAGTQLATEGTYYFYAKDKCGNQTSPVSITLDKTAPTGTLYGSTSTKASGSYTNAAYIKYVATDSNSGISKCYVRKPGTTVYNEYASGAQLTAEGVYYFYAVDKSGNSSSVVNITLDRTAPTGTLYGGTATKSSGSYTNAAYVKYTATDSLSGVANCYVKMPGSSSYTAYTSGTQLATEGAYAFYSVDKSGNSSAVVSITLDNTSPTCAVYAETTIQTSGSYTNADYVKFAVRDGNSGIAKCYVKKPGNAGYVEYTAGTQLTEEGAYYFYAEDKSGNRSSTINITLDRTAPTGTLYGGAATKANGSYTNSAYIKYVASDSNAGVEGCYVKMPNSSYYTAYTSGTQLTMEGTYYFYAKDKSGNQSLTVSITLDKTKPTGTIYGGASVIPSGDSTNAEYILFMPQDTIGVSGVYVKRPNESSYSTYTRNTQYTDEGLYSFYAVDRAGNASEVYTVTLDRQIPSAQLYVDGEPIGNNSYTNGAHISFDCAKNCFVKLPDATAFVEYLSGAEYYKPGRYVFYGVSDAGNSTGYYTLIIDRTVKEVELQNVTDGKTNGDVTLTWTDGDGTLYAPIKSVTVNGKPYTKDESIYTMDTGVYAIIVTDAAGNVWNTQFTSTKKNVLTDTLQKEYYEIYDADGEYFSFASYDSALAFATERENGYVRTGEWRSVAWDTGIAMDTVDSVNAANGTYYIYKKSDSPTEEVAYFTLDRLNAVIAEYAKIGIESYYYWEKEPSTTADGENLFSYSDSKNILANVVTLGENIGALLDGEEFVGTEVDVEGKHTLTVFDEWNNTCDYNLIVVRNAPTIEYAVGEGSTNTVTFDRTYYFKDQVTVSITDELDEMAMFSVYDEDGELIKNLSIGDTHVSIESGSYTVISINHAGESKQFVLIISRNSPEILTTENEDKKQLNITIEPSKDDESHIQTLEIAKSVDGGETWTVLDQDDYGTRISLDTLSYKFRTTGLYKATVTDEFRTGIDAVTKQLDYVQPDPVGVLAGVENNGFTNQTVTFTWTDEANVTLTKNGISMDYTSGTKLAEDGAYVLTFANYDSYTTTYAFTIDTTAPELKLEGATHRESVNEDVKVFYTEENLTAELFKNGRSLGDYVSGTPVSADGAYRILVSDRAENKVEVEFTIDKTVDHTVNIHDKGLSNSVVVTANEQLNVTLTKDGETVEYILGSAITEPAAYAMTLTDHLNNTVSFSFTVIEPLVKSFSHNFDDVLGFAGVTVNGEDKRLNYGTLELTEDGEYEVGVIVSGNTYLFTVTVDVTSPTLTLDGVENGGVTNTNVTISAISEETELNVAKDGLAMEYALGEEITKPGEYKITATDQCGNVAEYAFTIDKSVDLDINIYDKGLANSVTATANEEVVASLMKDEEAIEYTLGDAITAPGDYVLTVTDKVGNTAVISFTIVEPLKKTFSHTFENADRITAVTLNGETVSLTDGTLILTDDGAYEIGVTIDDCLYPFSVTIDGTAPNITLKGVELGGTTKDSVVFSALSENGEFKVTKDGEVIEYTLGEEITEPGEYKIIVTDICGNTAEYNFTIDKSLSVGIIILIVLSSLLVVSGVVVFILKKKQII